MDVRFRSRGNPTNSLGGRIFTTLFGLLFGSFGLFIAVMATRDGVAQRATLRWQPTPCVVEESKVVDDGNAYRLQIVYRYTLGAQSYTGTRRTLKGNPTFDDVATGQRLQRAYRAGSPATCFVNPADPTAAVLERHGSLLAIIGPALFCSIFVIIGYGMAIGVWVSRRRSADGGPRAPLTGQSKGGRLFLILFGSVFLLVGLGVTCATFVRPLLLQLGASNWTPTEATVTKSVVREHHGDDSTTYSVYIAYRYTIDDRIYLGDRYRFTPGSSSGRAAKQRVVAAHPVGHPLTVYVNPADPDESVILRTADGALYLGLLPLIFAVVGAGILILGLRARRSNVASVTQGARAAVVPRGTHTRPFKRASGHARRIFGMLFFALFWNGIVSVFIWQCAKEWQQGRKPIFLSIFLIPFVLIGTGVIIGFFYQILRVFNPRITLEGLDRPLTPGVSTQLNYHGNGNLQRLTHLTITLQGTEHATYQRGTDSVTATHTFLTETLLDARNPLQMGLGSIRLTLPADAMHSFKSAHNRIVWSIVITGEVPHWPNLSETYELNIRPRESCA